MLIDNHGRAINYMRLAITDRCNLRCFYCMPESGIDYVAKKELLSFEEMYRMITVFGELGISKLRITGGEPFLRNGLMEFLEKVSKNKFIQKLHITTNGTLTYNKIDDLERLGIDGINLSLDTLDKGRFLEITRRNQFDKVMQTLDALNSSPIETKINMVVMDGKNIEDIYPMIELTKKHNLSVRFIEEMPFNGTLEQGNTSFWPMKKILNHIQQSFETTKLQDPAYSTSYNYKVNGYEGSFGIIPAYTRTFCGTCNRIRVTPQGNLRTCLYEKGAVSLRDILRSTSSNDKLKETLIKAVGSRAKDGFEAENKRVNLPVSESMATIGG